MTMSQGCFNFIKFDKKSYNHPIKQQTISEHNCVVINAVETDDRVFCLLRYQHVQVAQKNVFFNHLHSHCTSHINLFLECRIGLLVTCPVVQDSGYSDYFD